MISMKRSRLAVLNGVFFTGTLFLLALKQVRALYLLWPGMYLAISFVPIYETLRDTGPSIQPYIVVAFCINAAIHALLTYVILCLLTKVKARSID